MSLKERPTVNPFQSLRDYEEFIYTLQQNYSAIQRSTLAVSRLSLHSAYLEGELGFTHGYRITMVEQLSIDTRSVVIDFYGYELWQNSDKFAWYDPQPHPDNLALASTHPHHKHVPPAIKHNRAQRAPAAPEMSFTQPNLPALIREIEALIAKTGVK